MRAQCQKDADPQKQSYMETVDLTKELTEKAVDELEYCTCHYAHHLADSFAVIAYFHPDHVIREKAYSLHYLVAEELFHFKPESEEQFIERHKDKRSK